MFRETTAHLQIEPEKAVSVRDKSMAEAAAAAASALPPMFPNTPAAEAGAPEPKRLVEEEDGTDPKPAKAGARSTIANAAAAPVAAPKLKAMNRTGGK